MTAAKIAITLAPEQLLFVREAVRDGRAASVSGYIARAIERQVQEESLEVLVRELIAEHGEPSAKDKAWARRALKQTKSR